MNTIPPYLKFQKLHLSLSLLLCLLCSSTKVRTESQLHRHSHVVSINSLLPADVCSTSSSTTGLNKKFSMKVINRHGPCSNLDREKAEAPTLNQILIQDQARVDSIHSRLSSDSAKSQLQSSQTTLPANSGIPLGTGNYIVTIGLGTPKKDFAVIFDTGSDLTWIQCQPCVRSCYPQQDPIFNPSKSVSYSNVSCNAAACKGLRSATSVAPGCSSNSTCIYGIQYGDNSFSVGFFGQETLTLLDRDMFPGFLFGCGENNNGLFGKAAGLLGLGRDKLSVVSQTSGKYGEVFSYCLPSRSSLTGYLTFGSGEGVSSSVKFTPLVINSRSPSFYFLDLVAISVGGRILSLPVMVFRLPGTLIDSGTVITRLPPKAYAALSSAFQKQMSSYPKAQPFSLLDTCYDLRGYNTVIIPKISLYFRGKVKVDIDPAGILIAGSTSQVCLAFAGNSDDSDVAIIGNSQQLKLKVVYDVAGGKLGFGPGGCS